jgi:hypothetical protein
MSGSSDDDGAGEMSGSSDDDRSEEMSGSSNESDGSGVLVPLVSLVT